MFCCALYIQKSREGKEINVAYLVTRPSKLIFQVTSITRVFWRVLFWLTRTSWRAISFWLSDMSKTQPSAGSAVSVSGANRGIHTAVFLNLHHRNSKGLRLISASSASMISIHSLPLTGTTSSYRFAP